MQYFREVKQNSTRDRVMLYTVNLNLGMFIGSIMIQFIENTYHYLFCVTSLALSLFML